MTIRARKTVAEIVRLDATDAIGVSLELPSSFHSITVWMQELQVFVSLFESKQQFIEAGSCLCDQLSSRYSLGHACVALCLSNKAWSIFFWRIYSAEFPKNSIEIGKLELIGQDLKYDLQ